MEFYDKCIVWNTWTDMGSYVEKDYNYLKQAENIYVYNQGRKYIDGMSSMFNCSLGYNNKDINTAIINQLEVMSAGTVFMSTLEPAFLLGKKLVEMSQGQYGHAFFVNSGSEACETAIKMALQYFWNKGSARRKIISLEGAYHGNTLGALGTCSFVSDVEPFEFNRNYIHVPVFDMSTEDVKMETKNKLKVLEDIIMKEGSDNIAALIFEPVQLSNAANVLSIDYIKGLKILSEKYGFLLIVDEVATGFGRCGNFFEVVEAGFYPDIMMLGKGITSGYIPLGVVLTKQEIFNEFINKDGKNRLFRNGFTTSGNPLACACAIAVIDYISNKNLLEHVKQMEKYFKEELLKLQKKYSVIQEVRGKGLLFALVFKDYIQKRVEPSEISYIIRDFAKKKGLLIYPNNDLKQAVLIAPPLIINQQEAEKVIRILDSVFAKFEKVLEFSKGDNIEGEIV